MIFRSLDENGDWNFGHGLASYATGDIAIGLNVKTRILSWVNDCFFAMTDGIDWKTRLSNKNQRALLESDIQRIIKNSYGVTGINSFVTVLNGRALTVVVDIQTINSPSYKLSVSQEVTNAG